MQVSAMAFNPTSQLPRIDQTVVATLRFSQDRLATFVCSFASSGVSSLRVIGTKGDLYLENLAKVGVVVIELLDVRMPVPVSLAVAHPSILV